MSIRLATFCVHHLLDHGPSSLDDLAAAAREAEATQARDPYTAVRTSIVREPRLLELPDGRWECGLRLLEGAVLTHRVRSATSGRDLLFPGIELAPLTVFLGHGDLPLAAGGELAMTGGRRTAWSGRPALRGSEGWLPDVAAEAQLAVTWTSAGVAVSTVDLDPDEAIARGDRVRAILAAHAAPRLAASASRPDADDFVRVVWSALVEVPDLFAEPVPPLDELLRLPPVSWPSGWECDPGCHRSGRPLEPRWSDDPWRSDPDHDEAAYTMHEAWDEDLDRIESW